MFQNLLMVSKFDGNLILRKSPVYRPRKVLGKFAFTVSILWSQGGIEKIMQMFPLDSSVSDMWLEKNVRFGNLNAIHSCPVLMGHGSFKSVIQSENKKTKANSFF